MLQKLFIIFAILISASANAFSQNETELLSVSNLTNANLPQNAQHILPDKVPSKFNQLFDEVIKQGEGKIAGGEREVLIWTGNYKSAGHFAKFTNQMQTNFRNAGWNYESQGENGGMYLFGLETKFKPHRYIVGFIIPGDELVIYALMELHLPGEKSTAVKKRTDQPTKFDSPSNNSAAKIITVEKNVKYVNLMGTEMPPMPDFPKLQPKSGKVRGYVKDWTGKPLVGAEIGIRSSYLAGYYSGGQGKTDANGYYELAPPKGMAHFYNAGYQIVWGDGVAAVSLHPADGKLDSFVTTDGVVENFVLLPYGITNRDRFQENPYISSTYYGGSVYIGYYAIEENDNNPVPGSLVENSMLEVTLTSENSGQSYIVRQPIGFVGNLSIHNIPINGRYKITIKCNGKLLKIKDNRNSGGLFGMTPAEANGTGSILFVPGDTKTSMVAPQNGGWNSADLSVRTQ